MSLFLLTAKHDLHIAPGKDIKRGDSFEVFVDKPYLNKDTIFNNSDTRQSIIRQLSNRDIDLVSNRKEYFLNAGYFKVEERKNILANHF